MLVAGHSWGCHVARTFVRLHAPGAALVEIDPRLRQVPQNAVHIENHPDRFATRAALVAAHADHGVAESEVDWDRWEPDQAGGYRLAFNKAQLLRHFTAVYEEPEAAWRSLAAMGAKRPLVLRTGANSLNSDGLWDAARDSGLVRVEVLDGVSHDLRADEQSMAARHIVSMTGT
jgi:hypothetical protein